MPTFLSRTPLPTIAAVSLAVLFFPGMAQAFCRTTTAQMAPSQQGCPTQGLPLFWKNACVGISYQTTEGRKLRTEDLATHLNEAFATWTGVTCPGGGHPSITVKQLASTATTEVSYNSTAPNVNLVIMRDDDPAHGPLRTPGLATTTFDPNTGEIFDGDIELDTKNHDFTLSTPVPDSAYDLQFALLRIAGNFLGLARSEDVTSVMYGTHYAPGKMRRTLSPDDIAGICEIYPPDGTRKTAGGIVVADPCDPTPRHGLDEGRSSAGASSPSDDGCAAAPKTPATESLVVAALTALTLASARRRRRSSNAP